MGSDKAAIIVDGRTQLERTYELLAREVGDVRVSVRRDQRDDPLRSRFPLLVDSHDGLGPLAGILAALELTGDRNWLIVACDLPRIDAATVRHLLDRVDPEAIATAYASSSDGLPEPLCAVWTPAALPLIRRSIASGLRCPRKILINGEATLLSLPDAEALDNMNTPDDLGRLRAGAAT